MKFGKYLGHRIAASKWWRPAPAAWFQAPPFNHHFTCSRADLLRPVFCPFWSRVLCPESGKQPVGVLSESGEHWLPFMFKRVVQLTRGSVGTRSQVCRLKVSLKVGDQSKKASLLAGNPPLCGDLFYLFHVAQVNPGKTPPIPCLGKQTWLRATGEQGRRHRASDAWGKGPWVEEYNKIPKALRIWVALSGK